MNSEELQEYLDRHHIDIVRTHATTLDGPGIGKYLNRKTFCSTLPEGHGATDVALTMDINGAPHMTMWHPQREPNLGDIHLRPDLDTLTSDGTDPDLGHIICDMTDQQGNPLDLCPRSTLKRITSLVEEAGFKVKCTFELEFFLYRQSYDEIRRSHYAQLSPYSGTKAGSIYNLRAAHQAKPFMKEVLKRLNWQGIEWEAWNDEMGAGQLELNLTPTDPISMADNVVRTKQILFEVALDLGMAVTFMANPSDTYSNGMHIHHSLLHKETMAPAFYDESGPSKRSEMLMHWLAGIQATLKGAVSYLCPTINSYRRFADYTAAPTTNTWGEDNKSTAIRLISGSPGAARIENRLGAGDLNPYLALSVIFAGGLAGIKHNLNLPDEFTQLAWGLPASDADLPKTITAAIKATLADELLMEILGKDNVQYWAKTRKAEWLAFHTEGGDAESRQVSQWEYDRYFDRV